MGRCFLLCAGIPGIQSGGDCTPAAADAPQASPEVSCCANLRIIMHRCRSSYLYSIPVSICPNEGRASFPIPQVFSLQTLPERPQMYSNLEPLSIIPFPTDFQLQNTSTFRPQTFLGGPSLPQLPSLFAVKRMCASFSKLHRVASLCNICNLQAEFGCSLQLCIFGAPLLLGARVA